jgi:hypothetical protein
MADTSGADGTGTVSGATWFPLLLFGVLSLAASPLYAPAPSGTADLLRLPDYFSRAADPSSANPGAIAVFWLVAAPLGYLATLVFYRARARRRGTGFPTRSFLLTGLALAVLLVAEFAAGRTPLAYLGDLFIRALTPLFVVAIGLFVLARAQRSRPLGVFAAGFLGLVLLVNLYDLADLTQRIGLNTDDRTNVVVVGAVLVLAGAAFAFAELGARRRTT